MMPQSSNNTDRMADEHEIAKAVRIILKDSPQREVEELAHLLSKMRQVVPGKRRRASDRQGAGRHEG
jgi:hypothetical protein